MTLVLSVDKNFIYHILTTYRRRRTTKTRQEKQDYRSYFTSKDLEAASNMKQALFFSILLAAISMAMPTVLGEVAPQFIFDLSLLLSVQSVLGKLIWLICWWPRYRPQRWHTWFRSWLRVQESKTWWRHWIRPRLRFQEMKGRLF